ECGRDCARRQQPKTLSEAKSIKRPEPDQKHVSIAVEPGAEELVFSRTIGEPVVGKERGIVARGDAARADHQEHRRSPAKYFCDPKPAQWEAVSREELAAAMLIGGEANQPAGHTQEQTPDRPQKSWERVSDRAQHDGRQQNGDKCPAPLPTNQP